MGFAAFAFNPKRFAIAFLVFEFACNAKTFAIALFFFWGGVLFIFLFCFVLFLLFFSVFGRSGKHFLPMFHRLLLRMLVTSAGLISLVTPKKICVRSVSLVVICDACGPRHVMYFSLFTVISIDSIWIRTRKKKRTRNSETR